MQIDDRYRVTKMPKRNRLSRGSCRSYSRGHGISSLFAGGNYSTTQECSCVTMGIRHQGTKAPLGTLLNGYLRSAIRRRCAVFLRRLPTTVSMENFQKVEKVLREQGVSMPRQRNPTRRVSWANLLRTRKRDGEKLSPTAQRLLKAALPVYVA